MEKTVIITGASSGIGAACAKEFAQNNWNVAICYNKNESAAQNLSAQINAQNNSKSTKAFHVDVANEHSVNEMVLAVKKHFGGVNALVNNAGIASFQLLTQLSAEQWDNIFNVNVKGAFLCTKAVLPDMINDKEGFIINMSSVWGCVGASCEVAYSASKAALIGFTKALAKELGPSNINVNCIAPGVIDTKMLGNLSGEDKIELAEQTPLSRIGSPEDVAKTALFLASDGAKFITGQIIGVDGGFAV